MKFEDLTAFRFDFTIFWSVTPFVMESKYFLRPGSAGIAEILDSVS